MVIFELLFYFVLWIVKVYVLLFFEILVDLVNFGVMLLFFFNWYKFLKILFVLLYFDILEILIEFNELGYDKFKIWLFVYLLLLEDWLLCFLYVVSIVINIRFIIIVNIDCFFKFFVFLYFYFDVLIYLFLLVVIKNVCLEFC